MKNTMNDLINDKFDAVRKLKHFANRNIETIDYIKDNLTREQYKGYLEGNVIKYISRYKLENGIEDLKKAKWHLDKLISEIDAI